MSEEKYSQKYSEKTVPQILKEAREWLSDERRWCRGAMFRGGTSEAPERTCLIGAIALAESGMAGMAPPARSPARMLLLRAALDLYASVPVGVNDNYGHEAALRVLDLAIQRS